jgi:hypothetical protein
MTDETRGRSSESFASVSIKEAIVTISLGLRFAGTGFLTETSAQTCRKRLTIASTT